MNNVLTVLNVLLKTAVEWGVLERDAMPDPASGDTEAARRASTSSRNTSGSWRRRGPMIALAYLARPCSAVKRVSGAAR